MYINNLDINGFLEAMFGMRLSHNSYSDTHSPNIIGENDYKLALKLIKAGDSHSKFLRFITIYLDIKAPLYWWKQFDQYKVCSTTLSESTMHTIHKNEFCSDMFSTDIPEMLIYILNDLRDEYNKTKDKDKWNELVGLLPSSFMQRRYWNGNYQTLRTIYKQRSSHRLEEWGMFCRFLETLHYAEFITT
jgi:hypothetical protein